MSDEEACSFPKCSAKGCYAVEGIEGLICKYHFELFYSQVRKSGATEKAEREARLKALHLAVDIHKERPDKDNKAVMETAEVFRAYMDGEYGEEADADDENGSPDEITAGVWDDPEGRIMVLQVAAGKVFHHVVRFDDGTRYVWHRGMRAYKGPKGRFWAGSKVLSLVADRLEKGGHAFVFGTKDGIDHRHTFTPEELHMLRAYQNPVLAVKADGIFLDGHRVEEVRIPHIPRTNDFGYQFWWEGENGYRGQYVEEERDRIDHGPVKAFSASQLARTLHSFLRKGGKIQELKLEGKTPWPGTLERLEDALLKRNE